MKSYVLWVFIFWSSSVVAQQTTKSAAELKKEMGKIMHETNWSDQAQADTANVRIAEISRQMLLIGARQQASVEDGNGTQTEEMLNEQVDKKMQIWEQMWESAAQGENADILLAKPLREDIVEAYKNDESPKIKNPEYFELQTFLCIDMSVPTIKRIIEQMENFRSIKILLITCTKGTSDVDLADLFSKAKDYPLEQLHIVNFKHNVSDIPATISQFKNLQTLSLFNNQISELPVTVSQLNSLKSLYVDINPVSTLMPVINSLTKLETLGVAKTDISLTEIEQIKALLPDCKILAE